MKITHTTIKQQQYWTFTCDCEHQIIWGAWVDASFWERRSKERAWAVRTCKCQTKYLLHPLTNEVVEQPKNRCKGAFDNNMEIYKRLGVDNLIEK